MAFKQYDVPGLGLVKFYKRRNAKAIKISLARGTEVRVSLPTWVPYRVGIEFARSKVEWIKEHRQSSTQLMPGQQIGKAHRLYYLTSSINTPSTRVTLTEVKITHPIGTDYTNAKIQKLAVGASLRALKQEANQLLPQRLRQLASKHGFKYSSVSVKNLKSRWGSCNANKQIALNIYLMQLPWTLIDYVLVHELVHTEQLNHSPGFWQRVEDCLPNYKSLRTQLKTYQPVL